MLVQASAMTIIILEQFLETAKLRLAPLPARNYETGDVARDVMYVLRF